MDVPCPKAGIVKELKSRLAKGISKGSLVLMLESQLVPAFKLTEPACGQAGKPPAASDGSVTNKL